MPLIAIKQLGAFYSEEQMKVLFTADLHIKLGQKNVPINWAINRYRLLFERLKQFEVDLLVVGGDIFDRVPTINELEVFFEFIAGIKVPCIIYSGNHEAVKKNTTFLTNLSLVVNELNNHVTVVDDFYTYKSIDFIPYNKLKEEWPNDLNSKILCTHVRGEIPPHVKPEIPLEQFDKWDVVLAGDLHSYDNSQRNILYPGSPITTSFHRNLVDTGVIILETDTLQHEWIKLELPQLIRKTIQADEEMVATNYHHTIYEIEGDMSQLSGMENTDLLDKKVVKRESDTALILSPELTLAQEVEEYLRYVLGINDTAVEATLKEFNNYIGKLEDD
jgi:DNA repair exonuclease SbcCD nuclease subunit